MFYYRILITPSTPRSTLFPYTTLFRSETLTVKENIVLPLTLDGEKVNDMEEKAERIAHKLNILPIMDKRTFEISGGQRSEEHTSELQSRGHLVCRLLLEKKKKQNQR